MAYVLGADSAFRRVTALLRKPFEVVPFERAPRQHPPPLALTRLIEGEIIPRLLLAHQPPPREGISAFGHAAIRADEVIGFAHQVVVEDLDDVLAHIDGLLLQGLTAEQVCFDLLAPAARLLGVMWEEDTCSFADVTVGLCRLQQIVHDLSDRQPPKAGSGEGRSALLALVPGDQHTFGLLLVGETFRRAGWRTVDAPSADREELVDIIASDVFDIVGLSVSDDRWLDALPSLIADLRLASRNPAVRVIVGGQAFAEQPVLFAQVGADAMAEDARLAVRTAERLMDRVFHVA